MNVLVICVLLIVWCISFITIYIGHDLGDRFTTIVGIVILILTSSALIFH